MGPKEVAVETIAHILVEQSQVRLVEVEDTYSMKVEVRMLSKVRGETDVLL